MKRCLSMIFTLALLLMTVPTGTGHMEDFPFAHGFGDSDASPAMAENIILEINGETLTLNFDPSPEYTRIVEGMISASFYTYADDDELYELYLTFPEDAASGSRYTSEDAVSDDRAASVVLIVSTLEEERYYYAARMDGAAYPPNSGFELTIDTAAPASNGTTFSGHLTGTLVALDPLSGGILSSLSFSDAPFRFTLAATSQEPPALPRNTPIPTDELNSDMRRV